MANSPDIITPALLAAIRQHPHLPENVWYLITVVILATLNRPEEIPKVYKHVLDHGPGARNRPVTPEEQLSISRRMREALIKIFTIGGLPKTINALSELKKVTPEHLLDRPLESSPTSRRTEMFQAPSTPLLDRGQAFFDKTYGKVAKRVMSQMDESGTEDLGLVARMVYGYVLSNTTVLSSVETSFIVIAALIPQDVNPQLKGHLRGALNSGATVEEVKAVRAVAIAICEAAGMRLLDSSSSPGAWGWREEIVNL